MAPDSLFSAQGTRREGSWPKSLRKMLTVFGSRGLASSLLAVLTARWIASRIAQSKMLRHCPAATGEQPAGHSMVKTGPVGGGCPRSKACSGGDTVSRPFDGFACVRCSGVSGSWVTCLVAASSGVRILTGRVCSGEGPDGAWPDGREATSDRKTSTRRLCALPDVEGSEVAGRVLPRLRTTMLICRLNPGFNCSISWTSRACTASARCCPRSRLCDSGPTWSVWPKRRMVRIGDDVCQLATAR